MCQWVPGVKDFETNVFPEEARSGSKETWCKEKSLSAPAQSVKSQEHAREMRRSH